MQSPKHNKTRMRIEFESFYEESKAEYVPKSSDDDGIAKRCP